METCKFKVGQLWRTRRGDDVEIVRVNDLNVQYPVIGRMNKENWERSWTKDGKFAAGAEEIPRGGDLVELLKDVPGRADLQAHIGTSWKTRDGRLAVIRGVFHSSLRPLQGVITGVAKGVSWMHNGRFEIGGEHAYDLIERIEDAPENESFLPQVGDVCLTRGGYYAIVDGVCESSFPLCGIIAKGAGIANTHCRWRYDGRFLITEIHENDLVERISTAPVAVTNTPRPGDAPGSRDRAGPPTPRSEPVGLKESIGRLEAKGTGFFTVKNTPETYEAVKALFEFKADPTPIKWPKLPDAGEVWKTRGGKEAVVAGAIVGFPREICGWLDDGRIGETICWKENGRVLRDEEHQNDLVEFVRKIEPVIAKGKAAVLDYVAYPEAVGIVKDINPERYVQVSINPPAAQESIADEAKRIVAGVRRKQYGGTPERSFTAIADFWTALFKAKGRPEMVFTAEDVSPMMRLLKEARLCSSPDHRDSMVDIIGYTLTDAELRGIETPPAPEV